jgi:hypothetical protein
MDGKEDGLVDLLASGSWDSVGVDARSIDVRKLDFEKLKFDSFFLLLLT